MLVTKTENNHQNFRLDAEKVKLFMDSITRSMKRSRVTKSFKLFRDSITRSTKGSSFVDHKNKFRIR